MFVMLLLLPFSFFVLMVEVYNVDSLMFHRLFFWAFEHLYNFIFAFDKSKSIFLFICILSSVLFIQKIEEMKKKQKRKIKTEWNEEKYLHRVTEIILCFNNTNVRMSKNNNTKHPLLNIIYNFHRTHSMHTLAIDKALYTHTRYRILYTRNITFG